MQNAPWPELQYFRWDGSDCTDLSNRMLLNFMRSRSGNVHHHDSRVGHLKEFVVTLQREQQFALSVWDLGDLWWEINYADKRYSESGTRSISLDDEQRDIWDTEFGWRTV
ncbi:hypothetical protein CC2G_005072 [Coprinopsis cinerea AmutBmut pab1-1]|nr:hypothetical protein CC2G_005072 [Coprinopsis cinerea AmutBmut pab1-1]